MGLPKRSAISAFEPGRGLGVDRVRHQDTGLGHQQHREVKGILKPVEIALYVGHCTLGVLGVSRGSAGKSEGGYQQGNACCMGHVDTPQSGYRSNAPMADIVHPGRFGCEHTDLLLTTTVAALVRRR